MASKNGPECSPKRTVIESNTHLLGELINLEGEKCLACPLQHVRKFDRTNSYRYRYMGAVDVIQEVLKTTPASFLKIVTKRDFFPASCNLRVSFFQTSVVHCPADVYLYRSHAPVRVCAVKLPDVLQ